MLSTAGRAARSRVAGRTDGLVGDTAWSLGFEGFAVIVSLVSFSLLGRELGPAGYGAYVAAYAVLGPAMCLAWGGVGLTVLERVSRQGTPLGAAMRSALAVSALNAAVLGTLAVAVAVQIAPSLDVPTVAALAATELVGTALVELAASAAWLRRGYATGARVRMGSLAVRLVVLVGLYARDALSIPNVARAYAVSVIGYGLLLLARELRGTSVASGQAGAVDLTYLTRGFSYGLGIASLGLQNDGDKVVMSASDLGRDTGLYAAAYRVVQLGLLPVKALLSSSHLRFVATAGDEPEEHLGRARRYVLGASLYAVVFAAASVVAAPMIRLVVGSEYTDAVGIVRWLSPLVLVRAIGQFPLNGLLGLGRTHVRTGLLVGSSLFSMVLYLVMIPVWSWRGAIAATLAAETLLAAAAWVALVRAQRHADREHHLIVDGEEGP